MLQIIARRSCKIGWCCRVKYRIQLLMRCSVQCLRKKTSGLLRSALKKDIMRTSISKAPELIPHRPSTIPDIGIGQVYSVWRGLARLTNVLFLLGLTSCLTRAPTEYELDRRAGLIPPSQDLSLKATATEVASAPERSRKKDPEAPGRIAPRVERVWVHAQELDGGYWLQGTWVFLEVRAGGWTTTSTDSSAALDESAKPEETL